MAKITGYNIEFVDDNIRELFELELSENNDLYDNIYSQYVPKNGKLIIYKDTKTKRIYLLFTKDTNYILKQIFQGTKSLIFVKGYVLRHNVVPPHIKSQGILQTKPTNNYSLITESENIQQLYMYRSKLQDVTIMVDVLGILVKNKLDEISNKIQQPISKIAKNETIKLNASIKKLKSELTKIQKTNKKLSNQRLKLCQIFDEFYICIERYEEFLNDNI